MGSAEVSAFFSSPWDVPNLCLKKEKLKKTRKNSEFYIIRIRQFANCAGKAYLTCVGKIFTGSCRKKRRHNKSQTGEKTEEEAAEKREGQQIDAVSAQQVAQVGSSWAYEEENVEERQTKLTIETVRSQAKLLKESSG